ncbi:MAG TPA: homocysteine S-methyltransferase family protein, partial [Acidimicrobiales bacterium]
MSRFLDLVNERVVVYDGATGTNLQELGLTADDFGGPQFEGCVDLLSITRPDVIAELHDSFFRVGSDVVETNTFGAFAVPLGEYGIPGRAHEICVASARIAREVADGYGGLVAGSMGPGTKSPSLGQIGFAALRDAYEVMARGLLEGGADLLITETHFDLLAAKAAVIGARRAMAAAGREVPIQLQVTMEQTGTMLLGSEIGAALGALGALRPDVFGLNCATGPSEMHEHLRHLSANAPMPISCLPNMGLPSVVDGKMHYDLTPEQLTEYQTRFITELGVRVVGGCCGSTPEHLRQLAAVAKDLTPARRDPRPEPGATSMFSAVPFHQDASFLIIGERTNANGSKKFRDTMLAGDWDSCVRIARDQEREGAHVLDVCVDYVGRDGTVDMDELASRYATQVTVPLVLDSTEPPVIETGLQRLGGRAILNSANLEDGEGEGSRFDRVCSLAREYGAAVIVLLIDEEGQARDVEWKMRVAHRITDLAVGTYGLEPADL